MEVTSLPKVSMVLYTDGGFRQNVGGWGVHGYSYTVDDEDKKKKKKPAVGVPTTTGYIIKDDPKMQQREVVRPAQVFESFGGLLPETTNNIAEMTATLNGMDLAVSQGAEKLLIYTDSEYVTKGLTQYLNKWKSNGWQKATGGEVANKALWIALDSKLAELQAKNIHYTFQWVKGHDGHRGNVMADYMATRGVLLGKNGETTPRHNVQDFGEYDKYKADRHRFVSHARWYFNLSDEDLLKANEHGFYEYCFGHPSKEDTDQVYLGKALADTAFSTVWLKQPETCLDLVYTRVKRIATNVYGNAFIGRLDNIYSPFNHKEIMDYGGELLFRANKNDNDITNCTGALIVRECNPPAISYRAVNNLMFLNKCLTEFHTGKLSILSKVYDITDLIYDQETTKKGEVKFNLVKTIKQNTKAIKVPVSCEVLNKPITVDVTLSLGLDVPNRNTLAGISDASPKIHIMVIKESDVAFRYLTIMSCDDGYCIMANVYANLRILSKADLDKCA